MAGLPAIALMGLEGPGNKLNRRPLFFFDQTLVAIVSKFTQTVGAQFCQARPH